MTEERSNRRPQDQHPEPACPFAAAAQTRFSRFTFPFQISFHFTFHEISFTKA
jgi:hypothetical protein